MKALDGEIEWRSTASSSNSNVGAAFDKIASLFEITGLDGYEPGSTFPPVDRPEVLAVSDQDLHVSESPQRNGTMERCPSKLVFVGAGIEKQLDGIEPAEARQHAKSRFLVTAYAIQRSSASNEDLEDVQ